MTVQKLNTGHLVATPTGASGIITEVTDDPEFPYVVTFYGGDFDISDEFAKSQLTRIYEVSPFLRAMAELVRARGTWVESMAQKKVDGIVRRNDPRDFVHPTR